MQAMPSGGQHGDQLWMTRPIQPVQKEVVAHAIELVADDRRARQPQVCTDLVLPTLLNLDVKGGGIALASCTNRRRRAAPVTDTDAKLHLRVRIKPERRIEHLPLPRLPVPRRVVHERRIRFLHLRQFKTFAHASDFVEPTRTHQAPGGLAIQTMHRLHVTAHSERSA